MNLHLTRESYTDRSTRGSLTVDGVFECYTLEDVVRDGPKIMHETAIPAGTYEVVITMSNRFKRLLPLLLNVPGFEGIRIHAGNTDKDTSGCILVGQDKALDWIGHSKDAFDALFAKLTAALAADEIITITVE